MLNGETEQRVLLTVALIAGVIVVSWLLQLLMRATLRGNEEKRVSFWGRQIVRLLGIVAVIIGIIEIWHPTGKSAGGAIGLIRDGDLLRVDAVAGTLDALVPVDEWAARTLPCPPVPATGMGRELFAMFRHGADEAERGASAMLASAGL